MTVIAQILRRCGLTRPDGRPLFAYLVTPTELDALLDEIREQPHPHPAVGPTFCLTAAELWRRRYDGGPWTWDTILAPLGWRSITATDTPSLVLSGLVFWRRDVLRLARREFLGSIAREAGIPEPVLLASGVRIRAFLQALLADLRTFGSARASDLARQSAHRLPERLRNPTFLAIGTELALAAIELAGLLGAVPASVSALDRAIPEWRSRLPLRLDDQAALALVTGLVDEARRPPIARPMRVFTRLVGVDLDLRVTRDLRLPPFVEPAVLADLAGLSVDSLPPRMDLLVETSTGPRLAALLSQRDDQLRCEVLSTPALDPDPGLDLRLSLRARGRILCDFTPPGGRALGPLPWVFVIDPNEPDSYRLIAQGSTRFESEALVLAPPTFDPHPSITPAGRLLDRLLYPVSVTTVFDDGVDRVELTRGAPPTDEVYLFEGRRLREQPDVFVGMPTLWRTLPTGERRAVSRERLEVRAGAWRPLTDGVYGHIQVRLMDAGRTLFTDRIAVLPSDARVTLEPLDRDRGRVTFASTPPPVIGVVPAQGLAVAHTTSNACELEGPPTLTNFDLALRWPAHSLTLRLPFPRRGRRFVTTAGQILPARSPVALDDLYTVIAEAWIHPPVARRVFVLEAALQAEDQTIAPIIVGSLEPSAHGRHALPLHALSHQLGRLLAISSSASARVTLRILDADGAVVDAPTLAIGRFPSEITLSPDKTRVTGAADLTFEALRFTEPDTIVPLAPLAPGVASTEALRDQPGSWMIFARRGDAIAAPPRLLAIPGQTHSTSPLREAMHQRTYAARHAAFVRVMESLADAPESTDWALIRALLARLDRFPLTTFEALRAAISVPAALIHTLVLADEPGQIVRAYETIPFHWATLPIDAVARAMRADLLAIERLWDLVGRPDSSPAAQTVETYAPVIAALTGRLPGAGILFAAAAQAIPEMSARLSRPELGLARQHPVVLLDRLDELLMDLRRRHSQEDWPSLGGLDALSHDLPLPAGWAGLLGRHFADPAHARVAEAPLLAALCATRRPHRAPTPVEAFALRLAESYDLDYFAHAHQVALTLAAVSSEVPR